METTTKPSVLSVALKDGLITGLVSIIYSTVLNFSGISTTSPLQYVFYLILISGTIYSIWDYRDQNSGYLSLKEGLGTGTLCSFIAIILSTIFSWVYITFIDPTVMKAAMDAQREAFEKQGMSDAQIDQAIELGQKFGYIAAIILFLIVGFLTALIGALIMRKEKDVFAQ